MTPVLLLAIDRGTKLRGTRAGPGPLAIRLVVAAQLSGFGQGRPGAPSPGPAQPGAAGPQTVSPVSAPTRNPAAGPGLLTGRRAAGRRPAATELASAHVRPGRPRPPAAGRCQYYRHRSAT